MAREPRLVESAQRVGRAAGSRRSARVCANHTITHGIAVSTGVRIADESTGM